MQGIHEVLSYPRKMAPEEMSALRGPCAYSPFSNGLSPRNFGRQAIFFYSLFCQEIEAHDHDAQHDQNDAGCTVQGLGIGLIGKDSGDASHSRVNRTQRMNTVQSGAPPMAKWETAPVRAVKVIMNTLVPTAVLSS